MGLSLGHPFASASQVARTTVTCVLFERQLWLRTGSYCSCCMLNVCRVSSVVSPAVFIPLPSGFIPIHLAVSLGGARVLGAAETGNRSYVGGQDKASVPK